MYQQYPVADQVRRPAPPRSVRTAVRVMYAGAVLSALGIIIDMLTIGSIRAAILKSDPGSSSGGVHRQELVTVGGAVVVGLLAVALWIWMARASSAGRGWARIAACLLFGVSTLALLSTFARPHTIYELISGILVWSAGLAAAILLWRPESSAYLQAK